MKVVQINTVYKRGSTGKIMAGIEGVCEKNGIQTMAAYRYIEDKVNKKDNEVNISTWLDCHIHNRLSTLTGLQGCFSHFRTFLFLRKVKKFQPDIIHLHNIHGSFVNHRMLFSFIKKHNIKTVWTLHDCWSFTGLCPYFDIYNCRKWLKGCSECPRCQDTKYPLIDTTKLMWKRKKRIHTLPENVCLVTPSRWLAELTRESFLAKYPVKVINNGIDLNVFKPVSSEFRKKYGCEDKFIILGVAYEWGQRKGLDVFIELSKRLNSDYQIVLVGVDSKIEDVVPGNIITIHKTDNQKELVKIYSAVDVFLNPTREDNFPTVNLEALACGTPVVTFNTGGSPESITNNVGIVVECDDINALVENIVKLKKNRNISSEDCVNKSKNYDMSNKFEEYVKLYQEL